MIGRLNWRGAAAASLLALTSALLPAAAWAQDTAEAAAPAAPKIDTGDTAWILCSAALVLLMTPGLALFYGGMVRRKNVLGTLMQSFIAMGAITVVWALAGYTIAFGLGGNPYVGGMDFLFLNGVGGEPNHPNAATIPHSLWMVFQMMFAVITPALISGAFAERKKFAPYLIFICLWSLLVYSPLAHWVWSLDGWLMKLGALDFAGGTVVHISSGVTALVACIVIGKRKGLGQDDMRPHDLTMTLVGTGILWFGWFGFNGGSALASNGLAAIAFTNTHLAAAMAMMTWVIIEWAHRQKPTALGAASGAVAGLVGITPGAGFVEPMGALAIGAITAAACYCAVLAKSKAGYDDSLDTFGVHGVGGTVGALLTGVFCSAAVNSLGKDGLLKGHPEQVWTQFIGVAVTWVFAGVVSFILLKVIDAIMGLRMKPEAEQSGMDITEHGEEAYAF